MLIFIDQRRALHNKFCAEPCNKPRYHTFAMNTECVKMLKNY